VVGIKRVLGVPTETKALLELGKGLVGGKLIFWGADIEI
jgi:hypothetical protein